MSRLGFPDNDYLLLRDEPGYAGTFDDSDCPDPHCERCHQRGAWDGWNDGSPELVAHPEDPDLLFHKEKCLPAALAEEAQEGPR